MVRCVALLLALVAVACTAGIDTSPPPPATPSPTSAQPRPCRDSWDCYGDPVRVGRFDLDLVPEASGLAASERNPGVLYLLDDGPGTTGILAMRHDGRTLGHIRIRGLDARDAEAVAVGPCGSARRSSCLYVGDIGDNHGSRSEVAVYRVAEPRLSAQLPARPLGADVATYRYPDGAPDAEALVVDAAGRPIIVSKAGHDADRGVTDQTRVYVAEAFADGVLADAGVLSLPEPTLALAAGMVGNVVTAADARPGHVLVRTYDHVLVYHPPHAGAGLRTLASWTGHEVPSPRLPQAEAVAWAGEGCGFYTASEAAAELWFVPCLLTGS